MTLLKLTSIHGTVHVFFADDGPVKCFALGWPMYFDTHLECFFFQLPFFLESIGFGYICIATITPIILISLFGGIKENYRWFLLNQAIWDLLTAYNFICNKPTYRAYFSIFDGTDYAEKAAKEWNQGPPTCFYSCPKYSPVFLQLLEEFFISAANNASYSPLFLLTASRFLGLYFHNFYERHSTKLKTAITIIVFNIVIVFWVNAANLLKRLPTAGISTKISECIDLYCVAINGGCNESYIDCVGDLGEQAYEFENSKADVQKWLDVMEIVIPLILLACSISFVILWIIRVAHQLRFQFHHNRINFSSTFRIALVIIFQCITMSFLFSVSAYLFYWYNTSFLLQTDESPDPMTEAVFSQDSKQCYMVIRAFLDSAIVFVILKEYRLTLLKFFKKMSTKVLRIVRGKNHVAVTTTAGHTESRGTTISYHR